MKQSTKGRKRSAFGGFLKIVGVVVILGGIIYAVTTQSSYQEYTNTSHEVAETASSTPEETVEEQVDLLDSAKAELDAINRQLDEEETRLVAEKELIDARLEQIQEIRLSF